MNFTHIVDHLVLFGSSSWSHTHILSVFLLENVAIAAVFVVGCLSTVYFLLLGSSRLHTWIPIGPYIIVLFVYISTDHLALALASTDDIQLPFHLCDLIVRVAKPHDFLSLALAIGVLNRWLGITYIQTIIELVRIMVSLA